MDSPLGRILLAANQDGLCAIDFQDGDQPLIPAPDWLEQKADLSEAIAQLAAYFRGVRTSFDLPLAPGGTRFQRQVWQAVLAIPYGQTQSYARLAARIENPKATRAVGAANGRNPLPIVIPCHRVIGSSGALVGYGGGLEIKRRLLEMEKRTVQRASQIEWRLESRSDLI
jgi:methylated-DNA-[protein]-cysteine S-methyltransferase